MQTIVGGIEMKEEKANGWLVALSILIPIAGLIIFLAMKDKQPKTAKVSGICALVSFIISIIILPIFIGALISVVTLTGENGLLTMSENLQVKNKIVASKDTVDLEVHESVAEYYQKKYTTSDEVDISDYIVEGLKDAKEELNNNGISLSASGNKIYLSSDEYSVTGTVSDDGNITWSEIKEK